MWQYLETFFCFYKLGWAEDRDAKHPSMHRTTPPPPHSPLTKHYPAPNVKGAECEEPGLGSLRSTCGPSGQPSDGLFLLLTLALASTLLSGGEAWDLCYLLLPVLLADARRQLPLKTTARGRQGLALAPPTEECPEQRPAAARGWGGALDVGGDLWVLALAASASDLVP